MFVGCSIGPDRLCIGKQSDWQSHAVLETLRNLSVEPSNTTNALLPSLTPPSLPLTPISLLPAVLVSFLADVSRFFARQELQTDQLFLSLPAPIN